jgi:hypothetical protein
MFGDGGFNSKNETVPVASSVITNTRNEVDIQILQFSGSRSELGSRPPKARQILDNDDIELSSPSGGQKRLIPRALGGTAANTLISMSLNDIESSCRCHSLACSVLVIDAFLSLQLG